MVHAVDGDAREAGWKEALAAAKVRPEFCGKTLEPANFLCPLARKSKVLHTHLNRRKRWLWTTSLYADANGVALEQIVCTVVFLFINPMLEKHFQ